jgi:hypothetical protein
MTDFNLQRYATTASCSNSNKSAQCNLTMGIDDSIGEQLQAFLQNAQNASTNAFLNQIQSFALTNNDCSNELSDRAFSAKIKATQTLLAMHELLSKKKLHENLLGLNQSASDSVNHSPANLTIPAYDTKLSTFQINLLINMFLNKIVGAYPFDAMLLIRFCFCFRSNQQT